MQKTFLLLLLLSVFNFGKAQNPEVNLKPYHKFTISASAGPAIPLGSFSKNDFHQEDAGKGYIHIIGEPEIGLNIKLEGKCLLSENFGIVAILSSTSNKVSNISFKDLYGYYPSHGQGGRYDNTSFNYLFTNWATYNLLAGISTQTGNNFFTFTIKALAGYQYIKSPEIVIDDTGNLIVGGTPFTDIDYANKTLLPSNKKNTFAFDFGTDAKFRISKKIAALVSIDYLISHLSFTSDITHTVDYTGTETGHEKSLIPYNFNKTVSFLCFNAGLSYGIR